MPAGAGETLLLGIAVELDASGVARGVSLADQQLDRFDRRADQTVQRSNQRNQGIQQGLQMAAGAATAMGASLIGVGEITRRGLLQPMIREASVFEVEMSQLQFTANASGEELNRLRETAIQTGLATQFSPAEAASALRMLRAAGVDAETTYRSLNAVLDVTTASAGKMDLSVAASAVAAALNKLRHSGESAQQIMDSFAEATRNTNLQMENLPVVINAVGALADKFKMPSSELFAFAGILRSTGQLSAQAGQSLRIVGDRLIRNAGRLREAEASGRPLTRRLRQLKDATDAFGISIFDTEGNVRPMIDIMADIAEGYNNVTNESERLIHVNNLLGPQGSAVASSMAGFRDQLTGLTGGAGIRALVDRLRQANGVMESAADAFENTSRGMWIFIQGTIQTIFILLGETLAPVLKILMQALRWVLGEFTALIQANPLIAKGIGFLIIGIVTLSFVLGSLLLGLGVLLFLMSSLVPIVTAGGAVLAGIGTVLGWVVGIVAALTLVFSSAFILIIGFGAALYASYQKNLGGLKDFIDDWIRDLRLLWSGLVDYFKSDDSSVSAAIIDQLEDRGMLNTFLNILAFTRRIEEAWAGIKDVIVPVIGVIVAGFELWLKGMIAVVDFFEEGLGAMGIVFDENMTFWRTLGQVLGVVVIVGTVLATVVMTALASVLLLVAGLLFLTVLPLILLAAGIVGAIYLITRLITFFKLLGTTIVEWADSTVKTVTETIMAVFAPFQEFVRRMGIFWNRLTAADAPWRAWVIPWYEENLNKPIIQPLMRGINFVVTFLSNAWMSIISIAITAWTALSNAIMSVWTPIISFLGTVLSYISQIIVTIATPIINFFVGLGSAISGFFTNLISQAATAGAGLVDSFLNGIKSKWTELVSWFSENVAEVRDLLPGSDAKTGPLSDLTASGQSLITTFVGGVQTVLPMLTTTVGEGAQTILGALGLPTTAERAADTLETGIGLVGQVASPLVDTVGEAVGVGGGARNVTVTVGDITVNVQQATLEEAERLANMIMERIRSSIEDEGEATFV